MKKLKKLLAFGLCIPLMLLLAACSGGTLDAPYNLLVNEDNLLTWGEVADARNYKIVITDISSGKSSEYTTRRTYYSLSELPEGDYVIKVMALGGAQNETISDWSEVINFHKDYETGLVYTLINGNTEYEITKVGSATGELVIEDTYRGKPVTRIADSAIRGSTKVERITVGNNVTSIGSNAFYNCGKLTSVVLPDCVTYIGSSAFQACSALESVNIPAGLIDISSYLFAYCRSLGEIDLGSNVETIGESAFYSCTQLKEIAIPDSVKMIGKYAFSVDSAMETVSIGSGIEFIDEAAFYSNSSIQSLTFAKISGELKIGDFAFRDCDALETVVLPEGLTALGQGAFYASDNLTNVTVPASVNSIGPYAFAGTDLYIRQTTEGDQPGYIYAGNWLVSITDEVKESLTEITANTFKSGIVGIADQALMECPVLTNITLPRSVKHLGKYALYGNAELEKFISPAEGLEYVGDYAFYNCAQLKNVQFGSGLLSIGMGAFRSCASLYNNQYSSYLIPSTVTRVGAYAFRDSGIFNSPDEKTGVVYAGDWVVDYNELKSSIVGIRGGTVGVADYAFYNCTSLENLSGLGDATHIGVAAFRGCSNLAAVSLNRNLRTIEPMTFYKCTSLFNVSFPTNLTTIGSYAFYGCQNLNKVDLSGCIRLTEIGDRAFQKCINVKEVLLGDKVESIGNYAFYSCSSLTEIVLPDSVTTLGERAFAWCMSLESVTFGNSVEYIGDHAFKLCISLDRIILPDSVKYIGDYAFYNCFGSELILGNSVEHIGRQAFHGGHFTQLYIPASVVYIDDYAFSGCHNLVSVVMSGTAEWVGAHVFFGSEFLTVYFGAEGTTVEDWSGGWNSSYRPAVWGCTLSDDGDYVVSVTVGENTLSNAFAPYGISAPARKGYEFMGWATSPDSTEIAYSARELQSVASGTKLYAVWVEIPELPSEEKPETEKLTVE